jgi:hypothetical protein
MKLNANEAIRGEVDSLREELTFDKDTKVLLLVSYATDEMKKIAIMYPEVILWTLLVVGIIREGIYSSLSYTLLMGNVICLM